ncbi:MAG: hypothetical protein IJ710_05315 [Prevotella sp.]|nr:hypothetical protein [Prevotella sp.]
MTKAQKKDSLIAYAIDRMTEFLMAEYHLTAPEAMNFIYNSTTLQLIQAPRNGLYAESPSYLYEILKTEYTNGILPFTH